MYQIQATDGGGNSDEKDFTINVLDMNDNPPSFVYPATDDFQLRVSIVSLKEKSILVFLLS
jgi:hypothetical protein